MHADTPYVMGPAEVVTGYVFGQASIQDARSAAIQTPRVALEAAVLGALRRPPCGVAFSGGRDSSLVLAVATHVARREGLPDPIPVTRRFPDKPEAEESEWRRSSPPSRTS